MRRSTVTHAETRKTRAPFTAEAVPNVRQKHAGVVLTVGHSTRSQDDFIALLQAHAVKQLVDVRTIPQSRHNPQFNRDSIASALRAAGIGYVHLKNLGGLRHPRADSLNTGWRNSGFRGFADYMQTRDFAEGLRTLMELAGTKRTAIMCAEAVPWRCHRSLIGDALLVHGYQVEEIESLTRTRRHPLTPWAYVKGSQITYPAAEIDSQVSDTKETKVHEARRLTKRRKE